MTTIETYYKRFRSYGWLLLPVNPDSKRPLAKSWQEGVKFDIADHDAFGVVIPKGYVVIDCDNEDAAQRFLDFVGRKLEDMVYTKTPRGYHFWCQTSEEWTTGANCTTLGKGIDIRAAGTSFVIAPGSKCKHKDTGVLTEYTLHGDL